MVTAVGAQASQVAGLAAYGASATVTPATSQIVVLAVVAPPPAERAYASELMGLAPYALNDPSQGNVPRVSQLAGLVVYGEGNAVSTRQRAWGFVLDGHPFYVLDLGQEGTFVYDLSTQQWSEFKTQGYTGWNMKSGTMWDVPNRILGADSTNPYVWELDPDETLDEGFRDIIHEVTGKIQRRSRNFVSMSALRLGVSLGKTLSSAASDLKLRFSDDDGNTWSDYYTFSITPGDYTQDVTFDSLGAFMSPGRVLEISDTGGPLTIFTCDAHLDSFDGDSDGGPA
jgi:hypothetical protein